VIRAIIGKLGAGKTAVAVCEICEALEHGDPVVTNVRLVDGWAQRLARRSFLRKLVAIVRGRRVLDDYAARLEARYFFSRDLDDLQAVELGCSVCGKARRDRCGHAKGFAEGRGLWVLDEAHEVLNARTWSDEDRKRHVQWISLARHRGWRVRLVTHDMESLDRQIRARVTDYESVKNLRQMQLCGIPLSPVPVFLLTRVWNGGTGTKKYISRRRVRLLDDRANLYDTHERADLELDDTAGRRALLLPRRAEPSPVSGASGDGEAAPGRVAVLAPNRPVKARLTSRSMQRADGIPGRRH